MNLRELGETISTAGYKIGIVVGYEELVRLVFRKAGVAFMKGNDKLAIQYRDLAEEIERVAKKKRQEYESRWQPTKDEAFAMLDKLNEQVEFHMQGIEEEV